MVYRSQRGVIHLALLLLLALGVLLPVSLELTRQNQDVRSRAQEKRGGCGDINQCRDWEVFEGGCCKVPQGGGCNNTSDCAGGLGCIGGVCGGGDRESLQCGGVQFRCQRDGDYRCVGTTQYRCGNDLCLHLTMSNAPECGAQQPTPTQRATQRPTATATPRPTATSTPDYDSRFRDAPTPTADPYDSRFRDSPRVTPTPTPNYDSRFRDAPTPTPFVCECRNEIFQGNGCDSWMRGRSCRVATSAPVINRGAATIAPTVVAVPAPRPPRPTAAVTPTVQPPQINEVPETESVGSPTLVQPILNLNSWVGQKLDVFTNWWNSTVGNFVGIFTTNPK